MSSFAGPCTKLGMCYHVCTLSAPISLSITPTKKDHDAPSQRRLNDPSKKTIILSVAFHCFKAQHANSLNPLPNDIKSL